jgi:cellulose biosynthesis protein BcsQ
MLNTISHGIGAAEIQQMAERGRISLAQVYVDLIDSYIPKTARSFKTEELAGFLGDTWNRKQINHKLAKQAQQLSDGSFEGVILPNGKDPTKPNRHLRFKPEEVMQWVNAHYRLDRCGQVGKVLTFVDHRGSFGKSEIAATLAQSLTLKGAKVLLLDFNCDGHVTQFLGCNPGVDYKFGEDPNPEIFTSNGDINPDYLLDHVQATYWPNLDIVPYFPGLTDVFPNSARLLEELNFSFFRPMILLDLLPAITEKYDCIIIDTASRLDKSVMNAIAVADGVIFSVSTKIEDFYAEQAYSLAPAFLRRLWSGFEQKNFNFWKVLLHDLENNRNPDPLMLYQANEVYQRDFLGIRIPRFRAYVDGSSEYKTIYESMEIKEAEKNLFEGYQRECNRLTEFVFQSFYKRKPC